jgi:diguanylate cyclase (GGDEF)-like protein/PAS domain S-box-containing protein
MDAVTQPRNAEGSPVHADYLRAEKVRILYLQAPVSNLTTFAVSLLFFFLLRDRLDPTYLGYWTAGMWVVAGSRLVLWWRHRKDPAARTTKQWLRDYTLACGLVGVAWGLIYLFLQSLDDIVVVVALFMLIFGVLSSSVAILSAHMPAFVLYTSPQVLILAGTIVSQGDSSLNLLSIALLAYLVMLTLFARNANRLFIDNAVLAVRNEGLITDLNDEIGRRESIIEQRTEDLTSANDDLSREVGERQRAERQANLQYSLLRSVLDATPDLIFYKDYRHGDGIYLGCNAAFEQFVDRSEAELIGRDDFAVFGPELGESFRSKDREMLETRQPRINEEWVTYPGGRRVLLNTLKTPIYDQDDQVLGVLGVSRDMTEKHETEQALRQQQQSLQHLAHHDTLTDLPNRLLLIDRLTQSLQKANRNDAGVAVLFVDLDHFKEINDSLGHTIGDQLLKAVAQRLVGCVREEDTVARLGGDEFTVIMEEVDDSLAAGRMAEKIIRAFHQQFALPDQELGITTSIGISLYPSDGRDTETLLRNADAAMYRAKSDGRNAYRFYSADMTEQAQARVAMEAALHRALEANEFVLYFQPQIDLRTGQPCGCEALIRWQHPDEGLLLPGRFIRIAEETGQIDGIGEWVLQEGCRQLSRWQASGLKNLRMAINLSGRQLLNDRLVQTVEGVLDSTGCDPGCLELEITEGFLVEHPDQTRRALQALRDKGIEVAVDDFGTGYSALSYLKQFPISKLKIDYSFVRDIPVDPNDQAISRAIIALGHSLGLTVVAEGVELPAQASFLSEHGCDVAQGYLYARPMPAEAFADFWRAASG